MSILTKQAAFDAVMIELEIELEKIPLMTAPLNSSVFQLMDAVAMLRDGKILPLIDYYRAKLTRNNCNEGDRKTMEYICEALNQR